MFGNAVFSSQNKVKRNTRLFNLKKADVFSRTPSFFALRASRLRTWTVRKNTLYDILKSATLFLFVNMLFKVCFLSLLAYFCSATKADPATSYDILYNQAVEAYLDESWDVCITRMNEAIEDYHFYKDAVVGCRLECLKESFEKPLVSPQLEDMKLWEKMIKKTLCLLKCKKSILKDRAEIIDHKVREDFETLRPYDYLQLCYYKVSEI